MSTDSSSNFKNAKKIALFGFYKHGNFGDDLMAVLFGRRLRLLGFNITVYGLQMDICREEGFSQAVTIEDLVDGAELLVYGGGGAFLTGRRPLDFEKDILALTEICEARQIPVFMFSVGGDGSPPSALSEGRRKILQIAKFISFRNLEDVGLITGDSQNYRIFPDIVWSVASEFEARKVERTEIHIGIDSSFYERKIGRVSTKLLIALSRILRRKYKFFFLQQEVYASSEYVSKIPHSGVEIYSYTNLSKFIEDIVSMDLVISNRLHMGMVAMANGIPVIQFYPKIKSKLMFHAAGLGGLCTESIFGIFRWILRLSLPGGVKRVQGRFQRFDPRPLELGARGHYDSISSVLSNL